MALHPNYGSISRGRAKLALIQELALGESSQRQLAEEFGVSQQSICEFAQRFKGEIEARRADQNNKLAGLWIADKANRIAEYEAQVELINQKLISDKGEYQKVSPEWVKAMQAALKSVAEELGDLTKNVNMSGQVKYEIAGVDPEELS